MDGFLRTDIEDNVPGSDLVSRDRMMEKVLSCHEAFVIMYVWACGREEVRDASTLRP